MVKLAQKIKDKELRKKVIDLLKNPQLGHKGFAKYKPMKIEEARCIFSVTSSQGTITVERDVLNHSIALANLCLRAAEIMEKSYGIKLNKDHLLAAAIVHDLMKVFEYKKGESGLEHTGILLDHTMLGVAELYRREFPEEVIHIVASHFGETGPTPPRNFEALLFHYCDNMLSMIELRLYASQQQTQPVQLVLLDEETLRKIAEEEVKKLEK